MAMPLVVNLSEADVMQCMEFADELNADREAGDPGDPWDVIEVIRLIVHEYFEPCAACQAVMDEEAAEDADMEDPAEAALHDPL